MALLPSVTLVLSFDAVARSLCFARFRRCASAFELQFHGLTPATRCVFGAMRQSKRPQLPDRAEVHRRVVMEIAEMKNLEEKLREIGKRAAEMTLPGDREEKGEPRSEP